MNSNLAYKLEQREEVIDGEVVMFAAPSLNHCRVAGNIYHIFSSYLDGRPCEPFPDGAALFLERDAEEYRPDGMIVCDPQKAREKGVYGTPDLVVEVLSPSTGQYDRGHKKDVYERHGVREYWLVNPADRSVEQYVLENGRFALRGVYYQYPAFMLEDMKEDERARLVTAFRCTLFEDLTIRLEDVFRRVTPGV